MYFEKNYEGVLNYLRNILQLILSPGYAWEDISHEGVPSEELVNRCYVPLSIVAGLTVFVQMIYFNNQPFFSLFEYGVAVFVTLYASYYISSVTLQLSLEGCTDGEPNKLKTNTVCVYGLSLVALVFMIDNCMPMHSNVIYLLLIMVGLVIWKSATYMAVKRQKEGAFLAISVFAIILPPTLLLFFFRLLI